MAEEITINAFPVIHSRTLNCDYNSKLITRPAAAADGSDFDWQTAYEYIAASFRELPPNGRHLFFTVSGYCICGITATSRYIWEMSGSEEENDEEYLADIKGRPINCFTGIAFPLESVEKGFIPDVSNAKYWEIYKSHIIRRWEEPVFSGSENCATPDISVPLISFSASVPVSLYVGGTRAVECSDSAEEFAAFRAILSKCIESGKGSSFVTGIPRADLWDSVKAEYACVSPEVLRALRMNHAEEIESRINGLKKDIEGFISDIEKSVGIQTKKNSTYTEISDKYRLLTQKCLSYDQEESNTIKRADQQCRKVIESVNRYNAQPKTYVEDWKGKKKILKEIKETIDTICSNIHTFKNNILSQIAGDNSLLSGYEFPSTSSPKVILDELSLAQIDIMPYNTRIKELAKEISDKKKYFTDSIKPLFDMSEKELHSALNALEESINKASAVSLKCNKLIECIGMIENSNSPAKKLLGKLTSFSLDFGHGKKSKKEDQNNEDPSSD